MGLLRSGFMGLGRVVLAPTAAPAAAAAAGRCSLPLFGDLLLDPVPVVGRVPSLAMLLAMCGDRARFGSSTIQCLIVEKRNVTLRRPRRRGSTNSGVPAVRPN